MQPLFPFKDPLCDAMQRNLVTSVRTPEFVFELPLLSDASWDVICNNPEERERLEFLGDSLISASISRELFRCRPRETPGFYTKARSVLTANSTFAHLMHKLGFHNLDNPVKPAGDAYETILAVFYRESGPDAFEEYVRRVFTPLINSVGDTYRRLRTARHIRSQQRQALSLQPQVLKLTSKEHKNRIELKAKRAKSNCQLTPTISASPALPTARPSSFVAVSPQSRKQDVIDLTSDSSEEETRIPGPPRRIPQTFLQFTSPVHKAVRNPDPALCSKSSDDNNDPDQATLVNLFKRTSIRPLRELGTVHNPIMID